MILEHCQWIYTFFKSMGIPMWYLALLCYREYTDLSKGKENPCFCRISILAGTTWQDVKR